jgi:hypothetical protein
MKVLLLLTILIVPIFLYGQEKIFTIDVQVLKSRKDEVSIDSVIFNNEKLANVGRENDKYIIPENIIDTGSSVHLVVYISNKQYTILLNRVYIKNCNTCFDISFYYHRHRLCYRLENCTIYKMIGPVEIRRMAQDC